MAELDYVGVRSCGCITAWLSGDHVSQAEVRDFYRSMADSGREVRRMTLDAAKASGDFLPIDGCPHGGVGEHAVTGAASPAGATDPSAPGPATASSRQGVDAMTERQAVAFAHPQARADGDITPFRRIRRVPDGVLVSILTVNR